MADNVHDNSTSCEFKSLQELSPLITFKHSELPSGYMRLVRVSRELSSSGRLQCDLHKGEIKPDQYNEISCGSVPGEHQSYRALSYTWGSPSRNRIIDVNGEGFPVRENLWHFLEVARQRSRGIWLWVDAICINQLDVDERNRVVRNMSDIYSSADEVLVWLGPPTPTSETVLPSFVWEPLEEPAILDHIFTKERSWSTLLSIILNDESLYIKVAEVMADLWSREYWERTWIIQEFLLPKKVAIIFGMQALRSADLESWLELSEQLLPAVKERLKHRVEEPGSFLNIHRKLQDVVDVQKQSKAYGLLSRARPPIWRPGMDLGELLHFSAHTKCSDVRDRVFGLVGLLGNGRNFEVDYNLSLCDLLQYTSEFVMRFLQDLKFQFWEWVRQLYKIFEIKWTDMLFSKKVPQYTLFKNVNYSMRDFPTREAVFEVSRLELAEQTVYCFCCKSSFATTIDNEKVCQREENGRLYMCCLLQAKLAEHLFFSIDSLDDLDSGSEGPFSFTEAPFVPSDDNWSLLEDSSHRTKMDELRNSARRSHLQKLQTVFRGSKLEIRRLYAPYRSCGYSLQHQYSLALTKPAWVYLLADDQQRLEILEAVSSNQKEY